MRSIFHLAFNVTDLQQARDFYGELLGSEEGRSTDTWVDFDFFGHQLSLHLGKPFESAYTGMVDNIAVPMPHFGLVLPFDAWQKMADKLTTAKIEFVLPPTLRFKDKPGEQYTLFFFDPFGNPIELKSYPDSNELFNK